MENPVTIKRLTRQYAMLKKNPLPNVVARPSPDNLFVWHYCLFNMQEPYKDGFYHGIVNIPERYPFAPPHIQFKTPNGRFKTNYNICLSFTAHHPESWNESWNIGMMLTGLISFMYDNEFADGQLKTPDEEKAKLAKASTAFNQKDQNFLKLFYYQFQRINFPLPQKMPKPLDQQQQTNKLQQLNLKQQQKKEEAHKKKHEETQQVKEDCCDVF